jgi:circadian clock protein KaiC
MSGVIYPSPALARVPTGVRGLDVILHGGLLQGGSYFIVGPPGAGKTILGNQICFHHVATGGRAVYITMLTESHGRMLTHLQALTFFRPEPVSVTLSYISGYSALEEGGLSALLDFVRTVLRERRATLLMIDGLTTIQQAAPSELAMKRFLHDLHVFAEAAGCTTVMLCQAGAGRVQHVHYTLVDGVIELSSERATQRLVRQISVPKFRGSGMLAGWHTYQISEAGLAIYPRSEVLLASPPVHAVEQRRVLGFDILRLDEMLRGGVLSGSSTMLLGAPGTGKTLLGLHFLAAGGRRQEPGLYFGFYETPPRLVAKADAVGLDFSQFVRDGHLDLLWQPPLEVVLDALAERLLDAVQRRGVRRLVIDGLAGFEQAADHPERLPRYFSALTNELRARDVTTIVTVESANLFGPESALPSYELAALVDTIIYLRYVELRSQLYRLISIAKMREGDYDPALRQFDVTRRGIEVADTFASAEAILTGTARMPTSERVARPPDAPTNGDQEEPA